MDKYENVKVAFALAYSGWIAYEAFRFLQVLVAAQ